MRVRCVDGRFLIRLEPGEEAMASLRSWAAEQKVGFAVLWAIGAMRRATLGYFDTTAAVYRQIPVEEQVEVVSMTGNVALGEDGAPIVHVHAVLGRADGRTVGGHLIEGHVFPMLEVVVRVFPEPVYRGADPTTGVTLWDL
jgi:predicted DNA-binding protein with PD1-like motif